jgi:hypothetical protein
MIHRFFCLLVFLFAGPMTAFAEPLLAGAAAVEITPAGSDGALWQEPYNDLNRNGRYDPPNRERGVPGEPFVDQNGNGRWDGPYLAGFLHNSVYVTASGVHDPLWARALVLQQGKTKIALVALDLVGFFYPNVLKIRSKLADLGLTQVVVASTHTHGGIDTLGLWGPDFFTTGIDPRTIDSIIDRTAQAIREADRTKRPALLTFGRADPSRRFGGLINDFRDPIVIDRTLWVMRATGTDGKGIATLVNWTPHPETLGGTSSLITSDFPHYLRRALERGGFLVEGKVWPRLEGIAIYFSGAVGGLLTTLEMPVWDEEEARIPERSFAKAQRIGEIAARTVLKALESGRPSAVEEMEIRSKQLFLPFDSPFLRELYNRGVFNRETYKDGSEAGRGGPDLLTEVDLLTFRAAEGRVIAQMATVPGELFPEIAIGGYLNDPSRCWRRTERKFALDGRGRERVGPANPGRPVEPVLRERMAGEFKFIVGLANDELGYIVPANDFVPPVLLPSLHLGTDRCGDDDHYEETVSAGSEMAPRVTKALIELMQ